MSALDPLVDGHGRVIGDLRLSVVDRCNFRCQYCMPADGLPWLEHSEILSFEEMVRLVGLFARMGVGKLRLTGGEPLVRREFPKLVAMLRGVEELDEIAVTTNGYLLERDAEALVRAGVDRFNVSVDSLARDAFFKITRRDALPQVMRGLEAISAFPEVGPIKVNAIAMRDFTEDEVLRFCELARSSNYKIRFIEFMPLDADHDWKPEAVLTGNEIREMIEAKHRLEEVPREPHATARVFRFADGAGEIGFI
ncbi:MAG: radical SAM protein, partial [Actinomycetota bacterium]|nr:radical SAM protein [Actinomycetota bacterium]